MRIQVFVSSEKLCSEHVRWFVIRPSAHANKYKSDFINSLFSRNLYRETMLPQHPDTKPKVTTGSTTIFSIQGFQQSCTQLQQFPNQHLSPCGKGFLCGKGTLDSPDNSFERHWNHPALASPRSAIGSNCCHLVCANCQEMFVVKQHRSLFGTRRGFECSFEIRSPLIQLCLFRLPLQAF